MIDHIQEAIDRSRATLARLRKEEAATTKLPPECQKAFLRQLDREIRREQSYLNEMLWTQATGGYPPL